MASISAHTLLPPPSAPRLSTIRLPRASPPPFLLLPRQRPPALRIHAADRAMAAVSEGIRPAITLTEKALNHLRKLRTDVKEDLCLRVGVRQGGCSGMSYTMDFEQQANVRPDDSIIDHEGFIMVCDPKSLLFLYGMQLDYSDALIGGGFSFSNPNASMTCGCGKSFAA